MLYGGAGSLVSVVGWVRVIGECCGVGLGHW